MQLVPKTSGGREAVGLDTSTFLQGQAAQGFEQLADIQKGDGSIPSLPTTAV